jgi:hypothetical protein
MSTTGRFSEWSAHGLNPRTLTVSDSAIIHPTPHCVRRGAVCQGKPGRGERSLVCRGKVGIPQAGAVSLGAPASPNFQAAQQSGGRAPLFSNDQKSEGRAVTFRRWSKKRGMSGTSGSDGAGPKGWTRPRRTQCGVEWMSPLSWARSVRGNRSCADHSGGARVVNT